MTSTSAAPTAVPVAAAAPAPEERGTFVVSREGQVLMQETFVRRGGALASEITSPTAPGKFTQRASVNADESVSKTAMEVTGGRDDRVRLAIEVDGTKATVDAYDGRQSNRETLVVPSAAIPMPVNESMVMLEQVVRRARASGRNPAEVVIVPKSLLPVKVRVEFQGADAARVSTPDSVIDVKLDAKGRILSGTEPRQRLTITRQ